MSQAGIILESLLALDEDFVDESAEGHTVPAGVKSAAKKGLEMRAKHGRGGIGPGQSMARKLASGKVTDRDVKKIASYHARHSKSPGERSHKDWGKASNPSNGYIARQLWGGSAGEKWAKSHRSKMDK